MENKDFKQLLELFLPDQFKGLSKEYIIECVFNIEIQKNWVPKLGDLTVSLMADLYVLESDEKVIECTEHIKDLRYVPYPDGHIN